MNRQVRFDVPVEVVFDYLVDPNRRPEWQSSLRKVESVEGQPRVGQRWVDVTVPGLRPRMETTFLDRPRTWTEVGTWRGVHAVLTLDFTEEGDGCQVRPTFRVTGRGAMRPLAYAVDRVAVFGVLPDLRKAARLLAARSH
ncbi:SRPBCC family protein [Nocardioides sp.]|uniref:SRPBCC family protein n=1 Tax=Nocardioides sp. TaxID=35761 RepID=UPI003D123599